MNRGGGGGGGGGKEGGIIMEIWHQPRPLNPCDRPLFPNKANQTKQNAKESPSIIKESLLPIRQ